MAGTKQSGGRNAVAPAAHVLRGTFQPGRHASHQVPEAPKGVPEPPQALAEGIERDEWGRMVKRLEQTGALSVVDDAALYQYVKLYAETEAIAATQAETAASIDILEENLHGLKDAGLVACFQEITKLRQLETRYITQIRQGRMAVRQFLVEFGMTPSARTRVKLSPSTPKADPNKERYFGSGR